LILAGRNVSKVDKVSQRLANDFPNVKFRSLKLDLGSLSAVRDAAKEVNQWADVPRIDVLMNNAGVMAIPWELSPEGFEGQLAINHLGPFLFTNLIMPKLLQSPAPRVINITSNGHRLGPFRFEDYNFGDGERYNSWLSYGQSKTANMLFAMSLAKKFGSKHNLGAFSVDPGLVATNLGTHLQLFGESNADMVSMSTYLASSLPLC
jgi:NAD(P)-dependent dehydrogenase (short-subunit alcohol dehydrogenase family)